MTPAARLLAAADLIETTGAAEPRAPWPCADCTVTARHVKVGAPFKINATWAALLGPDTAPALAAWLRETAEAWDMVGLFATTNTPPPLAFADLILRRQQ